MRLIYRVEIRDKLPTYLFNPSTQQLYLPKYKARGGNKSKNPLQDYSSVYHTACRMQLASSRRLLFQPLNIPVQSSYSIDLHAPA
ncbi:hypothetical protein EYR41_011896 [Orbilia oligospora]|uniref:Uncharacterized protein n=1 Tax=Orbilia oligospora TaxID=2813651 RepID=A0A8H2DQF1_ORBOL|nr:hypothetical protein EYR41_011896 [Orbilia oligospora]